MLIVIFFGNQTQFNNLSEILEQFKKKEIHTKKGPVFQTAILAGIMASKKTSDLIPLCHPLALDSCTVSIDLNSKEEVEIICRVKTSGKTGVEMEALSGVNSALLAIYDLSKIVENYLFHGETPEENEAPPRSSLNSREHKKRQSVGYYQTLLKPIFLQWLP